MSPIRCLSSHLMSKFLFTKHPCQRSLCNRLYKEIGLGVLAATAAIETVAYSIFFLAAATVYLISNKPFKYSTKLLESSSFTVIWAVAYLLFFNIFGRNLVIHEFNARKFASQLNLPLIKKIYRKEDETLQRALRIKFFVSCFLAPPQIENFKKKDADTLRYFTQRLISFQVTNLTSEYEPYLALFSFATQQIIKDLKTLASFNENSPIYQDLRHALIDIHFINHPNADGRIEDIFVKLRNAATLELKTEPYTTYIDLAIAQL
jgi:hypothetical protein